MKKEFRAVIFDMDGTLIDNMMVHHKAWKQKLSGLGLEYTLEEVRQNIHGVNVEILEGLFPGKYSLEEKQQLGEEKESLYRELFGTDLQLLPGTEQFLTHLEANHIPFGIGTAASTKNVDFVVDTLSIRSKFHTIIDATMVNNGKPHPEVYEKVAGNIDIPLSDCLIFEDSPTGAKAAANGGAHSVILTTTHTPEEFEGIDNTLYFMDDFSDLSLFSFENGILSLNS